MYIYRYNNYYIYITLCVYTYTRTQNEVLWNSQTPSDLQSQPKFASIHIYIQYYIQVVDITHMTPLKAYLVWQAL